LKSIILVSEFGIKICRTFIKENKLLMETTTLQKINNLIKDLPDYLAEELLEYVEYLVYKFHKDEELSDEQKRVILRGLEDIKYGRTHIETTDTEGIVI
jgi:hypothetical protein